MDEWNKTDKETVKRLVNGDIKAFDLLYGKFWSRTQQFVFNLVKIRSESEEIAQDVFVKLWENKQQIKKFSSFDSYLFSIAYNATLSQLRKKASEKKYLEYIKKIQIPEAAPTPDEEIDLEKLSSKIEVVINMMPPRQKEVFKLKHYQNYSYKQIAEKLNVSVNTVENHVSKAHKLLKEKLKGNYLMGLLFLSLFF